MGYGISPGLLCQTESVHLIWISREEGAVGPYPEGDKKARTNTRDFICKKPTKSSGKPAGISSYISRLLRIGVDASESEDPINTNYLSGAAIACDKPMAIADIRNL